jgi:hypothetical protein
LLSRVPLQVVLKVLGQHAEPEHLAYLLSLAPRKKLGSLNLEELIALLETVDVKLALPLQTLEKLKEARAMKLRSSIRCVLMRLRRVQAFYDFDQDGDGALTAHEVKLLTNATGLVRGAAGLPLALC